MQKRVLAAALAVCLLVMGATGLMAHRGATGIVKERMEVMKAIGKAMKSLAAIVKGEAKFSEETVGNASTTISSHARKAKDLFPDTPESRKADVSEAAPAIWENKAEFLALADKLAESAEELEFAATDASTLASQMGVIGANCKSCHKKFRIKKE